MNKNLTFSKCRTKSWTDFTLLDLCLLLLTACTTTQNVKTTGVEQELVTAIDILLEPDVTMLQHAEAVNARLLKVYPKGFALDALHKPHITLLQRYVRTADLDKVYAAAGNVLTGKKITGWKLKAFKYYYLPDKDIGVAGIVIEPTADLGMAWYQTMRGLRMPPSNRVPLPPRSPPEEP